MEDRPSEDRPLEDQVVEEQPIAKLRWRCRRGMRELDEAMRAYLDNHYENATREEKELFLELLDMQDPELIRLINGKDKDARYDPLIDAIKATLKEAAS